LFPLYAKECVTAEHFLRFFGLFSFSLLKEQHGRFKKHLSISLSSIKDEYNDFNPELPTMRAAFFPTKVDGTSLHKSLENVSAVTLCGPSI
jgi:hypothetical protein